MNGILLQDGQQYFELLLLDGLKFLGPLLQDGLQCLEILSLGGFCFHRIIYWIDYTLRYDIILYHIQNCGDINSLRIQQASGFNIIFEQYQIGQVWVE